MKKIYFLVFFIFQLSFSQEIILNHNIGSNIVDQLYNFTCSGGGVNWARVFVLEDFGITGEYTINTGSFGIESSNSAPGTGVVVTVYEIDEGFPVSFDETAVLGTSPQIDIPSYADQQLFPFTFIDPIVLSPDVEKILVEVHLDFQNQLVFMGGTQDSYDYSWFKSPYQSCVGEPDIYQTTFDLGRPDLNYYITVAGDHVLGVHENIAPLITISPNPVRETLFIHMPESIGIGQMILVDSKGRTIMESSLARMLDVSHVSSGLYFLHLKTNMGMVTKKIIKN